MDSRIREEDGGHPRGLPILPTDAAHVFIQPVKRINDGEDVSFFLTSKAYSDLMTFLLQLNASMFPYKDQESSVVQSWELGAESVNFSSAVILLRNLVHQLEGFIEEAPPDTGARRFGNISFRKWYTLVEERASDLLDEYIPQHVLNFATKNNKAKDELRAYLLGSFGSPQRLDYGTGHELSFVAFLGCIWKLGGFPRADAGAEERGIVLGVIEPYDFLSSMFALH